MVKPRPIRAAVACMLPVLMMWHGLTGSACLPLPPWPHDYSAVAAFVKYGTRSGKYSGTVRGSDSTVYSQVRPRRQPRALRWDIGQQRHSPEANPPANSTAGLP